VQVPQKKSEPPLTLVEKVKEEAENIRLDASWLAAEHYDAGNRSSRLNLFLGLPAAVLAAISGASALAQFDNSSLVAGGIAIVVTVLVALTTFLNPNEQANRHLVAANGYAALSQDAKLFAEIKCPSECDKEVEKQLIDTLYKLQNDLSELDKTSPHVANSRRAMQRRRTLKAEKEELEENDYQNNRFTRLNRLIDDVDEQRIKKQLELKLKEAGIKAK
jgi:hypothetical protein